VAIEQQGYCPDHPHLAPARSEKLRRIVPPGCNIAYDVMARIGLARLVECRQCGEIQQELSRQQAIDVPVRTISEQAQKFVAYFQIVHQQSVKLLRKEMQNRGGYILHIDGTCEEGSSVLLVCLDSLSGQVLESRKIGSENHDEVQQVLQDVRRDWGVPLAVVHDLRQSLTTAVAEVFSATWPVKKRGPLGALKRFKEILDLVVASRHTAEFREVVAEAQRDQKVFERLRGALRICPRGGAKRRNDDGDCSLLSSARHKEVLDQLRRSLKRKARGGPSQQACAIVVRHLDKYWDFLFGHVLRRRSGRIIVPRTNITEESLFRTVKRQCRRLHGRGHLSCDMDNMLEAAPLVLNLRNTSYCEVVYGGADTQSIAERFSAVDPKLPAQLLKSWRREKLSVRLPRKFERLKNLPQLLARFINVAFNVFQQEA
jgi:hypothetical protein